MQKAYKPELIVSKDKSRYVLNYSYLQGEYLYATDGRKMIKIKVQLDEGDTDGFIPSLAYALGRKTTKESEIQLNCNGSVQVKSPDGLVSISRDVQGQFPICEQVIPKEKPIWRIAISAALLKNLSDSMGTDGVILDVIAKNKAILVSPINKDPNVMGLLMPMSIPD